MQIILILKKDLMKILLSDKTTKGFIRWGSDNYMELGPEYQASQEMKPELITGNYTAVIQPCVYVYMCTHISFLILSSIMFYPNRLDIVPCAIQ